MNEPQVGRTPSKGSVKLFLLLYFGFYLIVAVSLNYTLGPPGMSAEYMSEHKVEQDRYVQITKDPVYKHWQQRPELNPPDASLQTKIDFVEEYEARENFQAEQYRRHTYSLLFDFFRVAMVLWLILHFARKPFVLLVDSMIDKVEVRISSPHEAREAAGDRRQAAEGKLNRLGDEDAKLQDQTRARLAEMQNLIESATEQRIALLERETADRIQYEEELAVNVLKREFVDQAIDLVADRLRAGSAPEEQAALVDNFAGQLEKQS